MLAIVTTGCLAIASLGCRSGKQTTTDGRTKLKVAYLGLTCEAPIFVAQEKGFFKEEGLDVEFVKTDWDGLRDGLGLGRFDANHTLIMYLLKPIEQGAGREDHRRRPHGVPARAGRREVGHQDGRGPQGQEDRRPHAMGSPPFLFASRVLAAQRHRPAPEGRRVGRRTRRTSWAWRWSRAGRRGGRLRADRHHPARQGEGQTHRRPGGGRAVQGRILLRRGRQRQAGGEQPGRRPRR